MKKTNLLIAFVACFSLHLNIGCVADSNEDDIEFAEPSDESADPKFDSNSIAFTELNNLSPLGDGAAFVKVIKSKAQFKKLFGADVATDVDFAKEWVVVFSAGGRTTGGYSAHIDAINLNNKTLAIFTRVEEPGADCFVTQATTNPSITVKIAKPSTSVSRARFSSVNNKYSCSEAACEGGTVVNESVLDQIGDKTYCPGQDTHCITNDSSSCPQISPVSPNFCADGTIVNGKDIFLASADGKECSIPRIICLTKDNSACPQFAQLPPNFCPTGSTLTFEKTYTQSADGKSCELPAPRCIPATCN
jgi:hypothetical protein